MSPFRQPTEQEEDLDALIRLDEEDFKRRTTYHCISGKYVLVYDAPKENADETQ